jgi:hypothetical protein
MQIAKVELVYGSYHGIVEVSCDEDEADEFIISRAFKQAQCNFLPMCSKYGNVLSRNTIS